MLRVPTCLPTYLPTYLSHAHELLHHAAQGVCLPLGGVEEATGRIQLLARFLQSKPCKTITCPTDSERSNAHARTRESRTLSSVLRRTFPLSSSSRGGRESGIWASLNCMHHHYACPGNQGKGLLGNLPFPSLSILRTFAAFGEPLTRFGEPAALILPRLMCDRRCVASLKLSADTVISRWRVYFLRICTATYKCNVLHSLAVSLMHTLYT
jgi:hypothetical protein